MSCLSSTLLYADSGDGKTGMVGSWALYLYAKTGKKVRLYTAEPGGLDTIGHLIDSGIVDVVDVGGRLYPAETVDFCARGYNIKSDGTLEPPSPKVYEEYAGFAYEGGTSFCETMMDELRVKGAANEVQGAEKPPQTFTSGQLRVGGANQTYYGIIQGRIRKAMNDSQRLPAHILWTCREVRTEDEKEVSGFREIYGPQLIGKALTPHVPAWFGRTIHIDVVRESNLDPSTKKMVEKSVRKAFFKTHFYEGDKVPYIANPRLPVEVVDQMPESVEIKSDLSTMGWFFDKVIELRSVAKDRVSVKNK